MYKYVIEYRWQKLIDGEYTEYYDWGASFYDALEAREYLTSLKGRYASFEFTVKEKEFSHG
jgi:hypothetical protein